MAYRQDLYMYMLTQLRGGKLQEELSQELNQLIQDCRKVGKKGEITLTVVVNPDKGDSGQYFMRPDIKIKSPKPEVGETMFWATPEGNLQRTDPSQHDLDLRVIPEQPKEPKFVDEKPPAAKSVN